MDYDFSRGLALIQVGGFSYVPLRQGKSSFTKNDVSDLIGSSDVQYVKFPQFLSGFVFNDSIHDYLFAYSPSASTPNPFATEFLAIMHKTIYGNAIIIRSDKLTNY